MKLNNLSVSILLGAGLIISNFANAQWTRVGTKTYLTNAGDSLGIGTTNPAYKVDIQSSGIVTMSLKSTTSNANILFDRKTPTSNSTLTYRTNGVNNWQTGTIGNNNYILKNNSLNSVALFSEYTTNNIGIGTSTPVNKLTVNGNADFTGNVGIGTNNPLQKLHVKGAGDQEIYIESTDAGSHIWSLQSNGNSNVSTFQIIDRTAVLSRLGIDNNGNVGIGTTTPHSRLDLGITTGTSVTDVGGKKLAVYNTAAGTDFYGLGMSGGLLQFHAGSTANEAPGMVLKSDGNVGIGTTSPSAKLTLFDSDNVNTMFKFINTSNGFTNSADIVLKNFASYDRALQFQNNNTSATANTIAYNFLSNSNFEILSLLNGGNVGIGTNAPFSTLEVNGTAAKPGGGSWTATSDARLKQNVQQYNDGLSQIMKINPVKYHYNNASGYDTQPEYVGVLAQELKEVAPYMVGTFNKEGKEYYNVDNSAMVYMLINAVKELGKQNELKDAKNADLQNQLNDMQQCVQSLCTTYSLKSSASIDVSENKLMQNEPNPFNQTTTIHYAVGKSNSNAQIIIRDLNGNMVKSFSLAQSDKGQVTVNANELATGTYTYTLVVNSNTIDTKLMVITK